MQTQKISIPQILIEIKLKGAKQSELTHIESSFEAANVFRTLMNDGTILFTETALLLCLSRANKVIGYYKISAGGITGTVVDPKVIYTIVLNTAGTCSIMLAHNHPSGSLKPSRADEDLTRKIKEAGKLLDINLLDHIIITEESHYSFVDEGIL